MRSKRKIKGIVLLAALCATLCGCQGIELLDEIPKDFSWKQTSEEDCASAENENFSDGEGQRESGADSDGQGDSAPEQESLRLWEGADTYARSSLTETELLWYQDIERILGGLLEEQRLSEEGLAKGLGEEDIDGIFQCVMNDHPELFYVEGYSYTKYTRGDKVTSITFSGNYNADAETVDKKAQEITSAAERILAQIPPDASDYDKVKYVYDTLIRETDYVMDAPDNQNIYSVFVNHASVCQGYAKAAQYLLNRMGVECTLVLGTVETGEGHAWNLVRIDGSYYYMDPTWGDASYQMEEGAGEQSAMPEINYDYLNVTTEELLRTHTIGGDVPMPACVATEANYYVKEGALFEDYDAERLSDLFAAMQEEGREDITIKCADETCYEEMLKNLVDEQEIFTFLQDIGNRIAYARNDTQLSLTFWVTNE